MPNDPSPQELPILDFLDQRFPLLMVDKVLSLEKGRRIRTQKGITVDEVQFKGHFPGIPIFPGVLTIECFAQAAAILIRAEDGKEPGLFDVIGSVMDFRFLKPILPGDVLEVEMEITKAVGTNRIIEGRGAITGETVATGKFTFGKLRIP